MDILIDMYSKKSSSNEDEILNILHYIHPYKWFDLLLIIKNKEKNV
jgi:hypothetical protein